jgi:hypothetical protein
VFVELSPERPLWVGSLFLQVCVRVSLQAGRLDLAERVVLHPDLATPRGRNVLSSARAAIAEARGDIAEALEQHSAALSGWGRYGFGLEEAIASLGVARCLRLLGRRNEATEHAEAAVATFDALGAIPLAERAGAMDG